MSEGWERERMEGEGREGRRGGLGKGKGGGGGEEGGEGESDTVQHTQKYHSNFPTREFKKKRGKSNQQC